MKLFAILSLSFLAGCAVVQSPMGRHEVKIIRDDFGTPHIFAKTDEAAAFGLGYAQAEDRLEELLKNYRRAEGTLSEVVGKSAFREDFIMRMFRHREVSESKYMEISEKSRRSIEAFQEGVKLFMKEHPEHVPSWAQEIHPWNVVALSRYIIWGWPLGDAFEDLGRGGIPPDPMPYRGSNEWLVAPDRTESGAVMALVDPHLSWYDQFRFYESRIYGDTVKVSGVGILGASLPSLGHSQWCSIAMTTGSGDTADVFEETINPNNPNQYEVDGQWRDMTIRTETFKVKKEGGFEEVKVDIQYTHHGPIVAHKSGKGYAMAIPYMESVGSVDQIYAMMTARNLNEMKKALSRLELMGQNVMVGTVDGDIYYQRTGKVPIRPAGVDPSKPIPGNKSANDWKGIHKAEELVQCLNPPQGYMQNCNISPFAMIKNSPMRLKDYPAYVYGMGEDPPHQRAAMVLEVLDASKKMSVEDGLALAMNVQIFNADKWQARLKKAYKTARSYLGGDANAEKLYQAIIAWDGKSTPDSVGAAAYKYWKASLPAEAKKGERNGDPPPDTLTSAQAVEAIGAVKAGAEKMIKDFGSVDTTYGEIYRCGRIGADGKYARTYPVGGGNPGDGMATPRAINFVKAPDGTYVGRGGQTSTQVILMTKPPKSWTVLPLGESDQPDSKHWDDQAEKLFSHGKMKPTYFMDAKGLEAHTESVKVLEYPR